MRTFAEMDLRIRTEFLDMPGLKLTAQQVQRLCGVDPYVCRLVLDALVDARFLRRTSNGSYERAPESSAPRRQAKADLPKISRPKAS